MREIRLRTLVEEDHTVRLKLPDDVRSGPVDVIVRVDDSPKPAPKAPLPEFLDRVVARSWPGRSQEEIDRQIAEERDSWG